MAGKRRPCRDDGDGEFVRFFASAQKDDRDCLRHHAEGLLLPRTEQWARQG